MRLRKLVAEKKAAGKTSLAAYLTAGDPNEAASLRFLRAVIEEGADIVELGVPHTDPVADGPTNARAAERALKAGGGLAGTLSIAKKLRETDSKTPLVLFTYFNPIYRMRLDRFAATAAEHGIDGVLVVDLPPEESSDYRRIMQTQGLETIYLASPTTPKDRLGLIDEASSGFVYYVSRAGVTGADASLSSTLESELTDVRRHVENPLFVGFGISSREHVAKLAPLVDGVVVGSALVKCIEDSRSEEEAERKLRALTRELVGGLKC